MSPRSTTWSCDLLLDIWILETRGVAQGVAINDRGEWSAFYGRRIFPITSPVERSRRHLAALDGVFRSGRVHLPARDGIATEPALHPLVVVSNRARVRRPKQPGGAIEGLETLITMGELARTMDDDAEEQRLRSPDGAISRPRLHRLATELAALHVPLRVDWEARFGLPPA